MDMLSEGPADAGKPARHLSRVPWEILWRLTVLVLLGWNTWFQFQNWRESRMAVTETVLAEQVGQLSDQVDEVASEVLDSLDDIHQHVAGEEGTAAFRGRAPGAARRTPGVRSFKRPDEGVRTCDSTRNVAASRLRRETGLLRARRTRGISR